MKFLIWLAVVPSLVIALLIYKLDKKEKEPRGELIKFFLLGFLAVIITLFISDILEVNSLVENKEDILGIFLYSFLGVALIEEFSKWICAYLFLNKNKNFNYLFDGVVYVTFISLGFAAIENVLYTISGGVVTGVIRAFTTVPAHAFFGISSGYYFSLSKNEKRKESNSKSRKYLFLSLLVPVLLHGFYDFCLLTGNLALFGVYLGFVIILYVVSIKKVKSFSKEDRTFINKKELYCSECGSRLLENSNYCTQCGKKINS